MSPRSLRVLASDGRLRRSPGRSPGPAVFSRIGVWGLPSTSCVRARESPRGSHVSRRGCRAVHARLLVPGLSVASQDVSLDELALRAFV